MLQIFFPIFFAKSHWNCFFMLFMVIRSIILDLIDDKMFFSKRYFGKHEMLHILLPYNTIVQKIETEKLKSLLWYHPIFLYHLSQFDTRRKKFYIYYLNLFFFYFIIVYDMNFTKPSLYDAIGSSRIIAYEIFEIINLIIFIFSLNQTNFFVRFCIFKKWYLLVILNISIIKEYIIKYNPKELFYSKNSFKTFLIWNNSIG